MRGPGCVGVVGVGAQGGFLAARLARAGWNVRLWARSAAEERRLAARGIVLAEAGGKAATVRRGLSSGRREGLRGCSAVFFCVKSRDMAAAIRAVRRRLGPGTAAVFLQNGVGHEHLARRAFGPARSVIAVSLIATDRLGPGRIAHRGGSSVWLAPEKRNRPAAAAAAAALKAAGVAVALKDCSDRMLWTKLVFNAATNPIGALCGVTNERLASDPALRELVLSVAAETAAAARAAGFPPYLDPARVIVAACKGAPGQRNSMLQDIAAGRRTEIDAMLGPLLKAARARRVATPKLDMLHRTVKRLERELGCR